MQFKPVGGQCGMMKVACAPRKDLDLNQPWSVMPLPVSHESF